MGGRVWRERQRLREEQERRDRAARLEETPVVGDLAVSGAANSTPTQVATSPGEPERIGVSSNRPDHGVHDAEGN